MLDDVESDHQNAFLMSAEKRGDKKEESRTIYDEGQVRVSTDEGSTLALAGHRARGRPSTLERLITPHNEPSPDALERCVSSCLFAILSSKGCM